MLNNWRLAYSGTNFQFGTIDSHYVFPQSGPPGISNIDIDDQDASRPRGDGVLFGTDYRSGTTVTFDIEVDGGDSEQSANDLLQVLAKAWRGDSIRQTPGALATLTAHTGRSTFGRPRRFQPKYDLTPFGITAVTCDFATADDLWYDPEDTAVVKLIPDVGGGLVAPLASPLSTTATSDRSQTFTVGGTVPTWPVITIMGPLTNPVIEVLGRFTLSFNLTLAADQKLVIDTRPWARTIKRNGANVAGTLLASTSRLSDTAVPPGTYNLSLRGASATGTPQAQIAWRNAYPTM